MKKSILSFLLLLFFAPILRAQVEGIEHVFLIGLDGTGANYLRQAPEKPFLDHLVAEGASTFHGRCVMPSSSAVNWASMTMGAGPSLTGYTEWDSKKPEFPSRVTDHYGLFPSIFALIRDQKPQSETGVIYSWSGIGYLFPKQAVNFDDAAGSDSAVVAHAIHYIEEKKPNLLWLHFDDIDHAGHHIGWGTSAYYDAIRKVDHQIKELIEATRKAGIIEKSVFIITADHGGIKKSHGGKSIEEMEIPWIIYGNQVRSNHELTQSLMTYDTAATIAYIFGLKTPQVWVGRPIKEAFME